MSEVKSLLNNAMAATVIDTDVEVHGSLKSNGLKNIIIKGIVKGELESKGHILIDVGGVIRGSIVAKDLTISGRVETTSDVRVFGQLTICRGGVLIAKKIAYGDLSHESGARMMGQLEPCETTSDSVISRPHSPQLSSPPTLTQKVTPAAGLLSMDAATELPFRADVLEEEEILSASEKTADDDELLLELGQPIQ